MATNPYWKPDAKTVRAISRGGRKVSGKDKAKLFECKFCGKQIYFGKDERRHPVPVNPNHTKHRCLK